MAFQKLEDTLTFYNHAFYSSYYFWKQLFSNAVIYLWQWYGPNCVPSQIYMLKPNSYTSERDCI